MKKSVTPRTLWGDIVPMLVTAVLIIFFSISQRQSFIKTLPTLITLFVLILTARANRIAFVIGGANSVLYGISYYSEGLYFSAVSNALISAPIMFYSYFNWKKNSLASRPQMLMLTAKKRVAVASAMLALWVLCLKLLGGAVFTGRFVWLDSLSFAVGITVTLLSAFRYVDAQYINLLSCTVTFVMWVAVSFEHPQNINFVIISAYNLFRVSQAAINWTKIYKNGGERRNESAI